MEAIQYLAQLLPLVVEAVVLFLQDYMLAILVVLAAVVVALQAGIVILLVVLELPVRDSVVELED
jgi:hypothetical protein